MSEYQELVEQYRKKLLGNTTDYSAIYQNSAEALIAAQKEAYQQRITALESELPEIQKSYDEARGKAYRNAKLSAVNENEALAALGLAGNLQQDARSGVSETSRIAADNALRGEINRLNDSQISAETELERQKNTAETEQNEKISEILANYAQQLAEEQKDQRDYALRLREFEAEQKQTAIANALKELNAFGRVMTQEAADALGVPIGTLSYTAQKAASKRSGGGKSSSSKLGTKAQSVLEEAAKYLSASTDTYWDSYNSVLHGVNVEDLPAYRANEYLKGQLRSKNITEKQLKTMKSILGMN